MFSRLLGWLRQRADRDLPQHLRASRRGEDTAYDHLKNQGYRVVARNFRSRKGRGEIDLVAWDGDELVFVEVKTRKNEDFGTPLEAVGADKRGHLVRTALEYARRAGYNSLNGHQDNRRRQLSDPALALWRHLKGYSQRCDFRRASHPGNGRD